MYGRGELKNGRLLFSSRFHPSHAKTCLYGRDGRGRYLSYIYVCRERELSKKEKEQQERGGGGNVYKSGSRKNRVREGRPDEMYLTLA